MQYILIFIYLIFLVGLYTFVITRMKMLSNKHMVNTGLEPLGKGYYIIRRRLIVVLILMFIISSFLILTFFKNGIFQKVGLYDNKETLDITSF